MSALVARSGVQPDGVSSTLEDGIRGVLGSSGTKELELIAFDGDDTLWNTQHLYEAAKDEFEELCKGIGAWDSALRKEIDNVDARRVATLGFSSVRFPGSLVEVLNSYATRNGTKLSKSTIDRVREIGEGVFRASSPVQAGVPSLLQALSQHYRLILITKGDPVVQRRRLDGSGLRKYFESVHIVEDKSADILRGIFVSKGVDPSHVLVVGDSLRSDIRPALDVGAAAVWIPSQGWHYERAEDPVSGRFAQAGSLEDLHALL